MRILALLIAFSLFCTPAFSQLQGGLSGLYFIQTIPEWESAIFGLRSNERLLNNGYGGAIDFKVAGFENYRVQFYLHAQRNQFESSLDARNFKLAQNTFSLSSKIFLLSLEADCDCPTFSRDAGILEKGFFIEIIPGFSNFQAEASEATVISEDDGWSFKLGLGMGLEVGLNDYVTISPFVRFNRYFNLEWEELQEDIAAFDNTNPLEGSNNSPINQFAAGLRLALTLQR
ncbi:MAG: hypothetical protein AAGJ18_07720 [Bacteroidota bacterium]